MQQIRGRSTQFLAVLVLLSASGCSLAEAKFNSCWLVSDKVGQVLHSHPSPDGTYVVSVVKEDCGGINNGTVFNCSTYLDVQYASGGSLYAPPLQLGVCDMKVHWLDDNRFEVALPNGSNYKVDVRDYDTSLP